MKQWIYLLVLLLMSLSPSLQALTTAADAPATVQSVADAKQGIIDTLVSLVAGLAATASDLIYMTTPSSLVAMNTNSALNVSNQEVQSYLTTAFQGPTQTNLSGYISSVDPAQTSITQNSGYLVLDIYNALNSSSDDLSRSDSILSNVKNLASYNDIQTAYKNLLAEKTACDKDHDPNGPGCAAMVQTEADVRRGILQGIFGNPNDPIVKSYVDNDIAYNPETLFSTMSYATDSPSANNLIDQNKLTQAGVFINQLSQLAPLPDPRPTTFPEPMTKAQSNNLTAQLASDPTTLSQIQSLQDAYVQKMMQIVAAKNMAMDNLYAIHAKRMPQASIFSKHLVDPSTQKPITSPLQLESYAATRRLNSDYYAEIAGAPPTAVARETLFVLAEIRQQLFQNQLMAERLLATLSVSALGAVAAKTDETDKINTSLKTQIDLILSGALNSANQGAQGNVSIPPTGSEASS